MIKMENTGVFGFEGAIRGMRNPKKSWDKSDSGWCPNDNIPDYKITEPIPDKEFIVGLNDLKLAKNLILAGTDHSKFMRMIHVQVDITAPMYWWKEMDTYKVRTVRDSTSTMHTIMNKEFDINDFSHEHVFNDNLVRVNHMPGDFRILNNLQWLMLTIDLLNDMRDNYISEADMKKKKECWWQIIQLLPSSYNQMATWDANYQVLRNIYFSRRNHKLDEWREFCKWVKDLPYSELITCEKGD